VRSFNDCNRYTLEGDGTVYSVHKYLERDGIKGSANNYNEAFEKSAFTQ